MYCISKEDFKITLKNHNFNTKNNFSSIGDWINKNQTIFQNKLIYLGLADGVWISNPSSNKWPPIINNDIATFQYSFKKVK